MSIEDDNFIPLTQEQINKICEDAGFDVLGIDPEELTPEMRKIRAPLARKWVKSIFKGSGLFKNLFGDENDQSKN